MSEYYAVQSNNPRNELAGSGMKKEAPM